MDEYADVHIDAAKKTSRVNWLLHLLGVGLEGIISATKQGRRDYLIYEQGMELAELFSLRPQGWLNDEERLSYQALVNLAALHNVPFEATSEADMRAYHRKRLLAEEEQEQDEIRGLLAKEQKQKETRERRQRAKAQQKYKREEDKAEQYGYMSSKMFGTGTSKPMSPAEQERALLEYRIATSKEKKILQLTRNEAMSKGWIPNRRPDF
jgi:hypothetical protein